MERIDFDVAEGGSQPSRPPASDGRPSVVRDFLDGEVNGTVPSNISEMVDILRFER